MEDSPISRVIRRMARKACGLPEEDEKGHGAGLFRWARRGFTKLRADDGSGEAREDASQSLGSSTTLGADRAKS
jgi:hypothetical protein